MIKCADHVTVIIKTQCPSFPFHSKGLNPSSFVLWRHVTDGLNLPGAVAARYKEAV
jgi:hypothetical protein